jgi:hypothetical protein
MKSVLSGLFGPVPLEAWRPGQRVGSLADDVIDPVAGNVVIHGIAMQL